jgi:Dolichyl-phosphate-mannose-protein mannosyltransferase
VELFQKKQKRNQRRLLVVVPVEGTKRRKLMTTTELVLRARNRIERIYDALIDPARSERTMLLVLAGYLAAWSVFAAISKSSQDIHPDMAEMAAWSHEAGLGTPKHPPLAAWLVRGWFSVFPRDDWAYYLFAMVLPTIALWITWRMAARYLPREKRVVGIALLTLVPFYNFHALKFNANTVLTPLWAVTTWWFLRSFAMRHAVWAVLAGISAAAAMLGKYWSITLLAALGLAALTDPRRDAYFRSPAPLLTLAVATILLTPHLDWLIANHFAPFTYAIDLHPATLLTAAKSVLGFLGGSLGYIAAPIVLCLLAVRPDAAAIGDTLWPPEPERRILVVAFAGPFLFAVLIAVLLRVGIPSLWSISAMTLLPVILLSSPRVTIPRPAAIGLLALAIAYPPAMVAASPVIAIVAHRAGVPNFASDYRLIAQAVDTAWRGHSDKPLRIVGSTDVIVNGIAFYLADPPATFELFSPAHTPWVDDESIRRDGMAMVCPYDSAPCGRVFDGYVEHYHAIAVERITLARSFLGMRETPVQYEIGIIPPRP